MTIPARISFITLACKDMERMTRFYRQFGWPEAPSSEDVHVVFQCTNGVVLALYAAKNYEPEYGAVTDGFRAFTLCINCRDWDEVGTVHEAVRAMDDVQALDEPERAHWGGGFSFRDPEGNVWDVAWAEGSASMTAAASYFPRKLD